MPAARQTKRTRAPNRGSRQGPTASVPDWQNLIRQLAQFRADQGLTQAEVARQMKTSQPYVARLETANVDPRLSTVLRYALVVAGSIAVAGLLKELARGAVPPIRLR
jgi:transcriptional regulator with XRE-family HTH domain